MAVREGRILISSANDPDFGSEYYVTAYEVGAQVTSASSGDTVTVRSGHGFEADDWFIVASEFPAFTKFRRVDSVDATHLYLDTGVNVSVVKGDILVNLGQDTGGVAGPFYDGSGATIYTDMAFAETAPLSTVVTDANGRYRYWHQGIDIWELVQTPNGLPFTVVLSAAEAAVSGPESVTDDAVATWESSTGALKSNVVTISDAGAMTGVTTLNASGLITGTNGATISGVSSLVTVNATGLITGSLGLTITGAVAQLNTLDVNSTSQFDGAVTLAGGVTGNVAASGNVSGVDATFTGNIYSSVAAAVTAAGTTQGTATALTKDINNVSTVGSGLSVRLPSASAGRVCTVINNGLNTLNIFPASLDNLGTGVDTVTTLNAGSNRTFVAIDSTNWEVI